MSNQQETSKRIAKNTLLLYVRMLFLMLISLYTSRVVLKALGIEDFGIYNVVGGVVAMFSIISGSLSASITRFLNYEMGIGNISRLKHIFSSSVTTQLLLSLIIIILGESIGLWFLNNKMIIPEERCFAANWVFQLSIITFIINLISVPYNAAIIAHEKMSAFAYIGIFEGVAKLCVAYLLTIAPFDHLISYAILMCLIAMIVRFAYGRYCSIHFEECEYSFTFDKKLLKELFSFAGWNFIGAIAGVLREQGGNILLNLFCGPAINAARGISSQVNNAVSGFVTNFTMALNPQITQSYSSGKRAYMQVLMYQGAKMSYYILLILSLPIIINTTYILQLWLGDYPDYTDSFVRLILFLSMWESMAFPMSTGLLATGNIKYYQICVGGLNLLNIPVSYVFLRYGFSPNVVLIVAIMISQLALFMRLYFIKRLLFFNIREFLTEVYLRILAVTFFSMIMPLCIYLNWNGTLSSFVVVSVISILSTSFIIWMIGCNEDERSLIKKHVVKVSIKIKNR